MRVTILWTRVFLLCGCLGLLFAPAATAGLITGGNAALSYDGSEIGGFGEPVVWAWNCLGSSNVTVQGVTFETAKPGGITLANFGYARTAEAATGDLYDATMQPLMKSLYCTNPNALDDMLTINGLTVGQQYIVQFLHHHVKTDVPPVREGTVLFGGDSSGTALGSMFDSGDATGHITTAAFTADATTQAFYFDVYNTNDRIPLNGVVLFGVPPEPELISHWTFDAADQLNDVVGDNNGTPIGGAAITTAAGESIVGDGALKLESANGQFIKINGMVGDLNSGNEMTVGMWFNTEDTSTAAHQLFSAHTAAGGNIFRLGVTGDGDIFLNPTDIGGLTYDKVASASSPLNDGQWHFLTVSAHNSDVQVTIDGEVIGDGIFISTSGQPNWSGATQFSIGQEYDSSVAGDFFDGLIDDVKVWNYTLTMDEIEAEYQSVIPEPSTFALLAVGLAMLFAGGRRKR